MSAQNRNQAGAILPLTLVFSLLLAMVSAGAMHTAGLQWPASIWRTLLDGAVAWLAVACPPAMTLSLQTRR